MSVARVARDTFKHFPQRRGRGVRQGGGVGQQLRMRATPGAWPVDGPIRRQAIREHAKCTVNAPSQCRTSVLIANSQRMQVADGLQAIRLEAGKQVGIEVQVVQRQLA